MKYEQDIITVAVVNFKVNTKDKENNLKRITGFAEAAAKRGADLVLFPELCVMGYDYYVDKGIELAEKIQTAETLDGEICKAISKVAEKHGIYVVFGMAEKRSSDAAEIYNSAVAIGPKGVLGSYQKIHPFEEENLWFTKGETPFMFDTPWGPISIGICYDTYQFPELMRHYVAKGSRLYLNPTAVVEEIDKAGGRQAFINYYAPTLEYGVLCNTIFIASANLTAYDGSIYFGGGSAIIGPKLTPFFETDFTYYAGDKDNVQEGIYLSTLDLTLARRRLCDEETCTGVADYRPELYKKF
ncbi:MAG TPA: carbon-nitrogen hydrolase family protein [Anaerovoracaceae bacterium]|nr:carbon-nitrogen hydrolase family protein [Anaerovoracaceae bacterium]